MQKNSPFGIERVDYIEKITRSHYGGTNEKRKYSIYSDGKITIQRFEDNSRKPVYKKEHQFSIVRTHDFFRALVDCARNIDGCTSFLSDSSATVTIHYQFGHTETLDECLTSKGNSISEIVSHYLNVLEDY